VTTESHSAQDWYRVAQARPRLRREATVRRHLYLGRPWYILSDQTGTKVHRLTPAAQEIAGRLDGATTVESIWQQVAADLGPDAPTQDEVIQLLTQLHQADLLDSAETPLLADLLERRDKDRVQLWRKMLMNPLSITLPLLDPDRFLQVLCRVMGVVPRPAWWLAALALMLWALVRLPLHWQALANRGLEGFLDLENLGLIALVYPVVKALHEIGHGVAARSRGGEVHEMGLMFIAFYPLPYVEASSSLAFPSKWDRAAVAAAGVVVELTVASAAFLLWTVAEPGLVRTILFNTMVVSGLSTLAVNGNPLMKFDGYHVMCDLIEIPNLSKRGNAWWGEQLRVRLLGTAERPRARMRTVAWERWWFLLYPPLAFVYRIWISLTIALFVAGTYRAVGVLLAIWSLALTFAWPAAKVAHQALTDQRIRRAGPRALAGAGGAGLVLALVFLALPLPHHAMVQGVTWLPQEAFLRAPQPGRVIAARAADGAEVSAGTPLFTFDAPELLAEARIGEARLIRAEAKFAEARTTDRASAERLRARIAEARAARDTAAANLADLDLRAGIAGRLDLPDTTDPLGRFYRRGEVIGHVLPGTPPLIRLVVPQDLAELIRSETRAVDVRLASDLSHRLGARIVRAVPAGEDQLPSAVLSLDGGGPYATVPGDELRSVTRLFQLDLALEEQPAVPHYGMRAHVRLTFAPKPLAVRAARALRNLFLDAFDV